MPDLNVTKLSLSSSAGTHTEREGSRGANGRARSQEHIKRIYCDDGLALSMCLSLLYRVHKNVWRPSVQPRQFPLRPPNGEILHWKEDATKMVVEGSSNFIPYANVLMALKRSCWMLRSRSLKSGVSERTSSFPSWSRIPKELDKNTLGILVSR